MDNTLFHFLIMLIIMSAGATATAYMFFTDKKLSHICIVSFVTFAAFIAFHYLHEIDDIGFADETLIQSNEFDTSFDFDYNEQQHPLPDDNNQPIYEAPTLHENQTITPPVPQQSDTQSNAPVSQSNQISRPTPHISDIRDLYSDSQIRSKLADLSDGLRVKVDDMTGITYYHVPHYRPFNEIEVIPYVGVTPDFKAVLFDALSFFSKEDFTFWQVYIKSGNGKLYQLIYNPLDIIYKFDNSRIHNFVKSYYNKPMTAEMYTALKDAAFSGYMKVRFRSSTYSSERELLPKEIAQIKKVILIYDFLHNK